MNKIYALVWNQAQGCWNVAHEGVRRRRRSGSGKGLIVAAASLLALAGLPSAFALPTGGVVVSGTADILAQGQNMFVDQYTDKLITNWNDFSVQSNQVVNFNQPSSTSIALNRVVGVNGSNIQGQINANGQVFLINPNGVVFGQGAQVNVGGLIASTQNITDNNFNAGHYKFTGASTAEVLNQGSITVPDGRSITLLGAKVRNEGMIKAQEGNVALGAGNSFTVSLDANNLLDLQVDAAAINALVSNTGLLKADGGQVLMTADAGMVFQTVVNNQGSIEANTLSQKAGRIILDGRVSGIVNVGGSLSAHALGTEGNGGVVETRGTFTIVHEDTWVNTQASNGQTGTWKVGSLEVKVGGGPASYWNAIQDYTLASNLDTTNVELASTGGSLVLTGPVSWNSGNQLTLSSVKDIQINGSLRGEGANTRVELNAKGNIKLDGHVELTGRNSGLGLNHAGDFSTGKDGKVTLSGSDARFNDNGAAYKVIQNAAHLQGINNGLSGRYVLGNTINGSDSFTSIGGSQAFTGVFDGLGNTISGFTVNSNGPHGGLFASSSGSISNLKLASMNIYGPTYTSGSSAIGGLVGLNSGKIANVSTSNLQVSIRSGNPYALGAQGGVGGLVGVNKGRITDSSSAGSVDSGREGYSKSLNLGGLVGNNQGGSIERSNSSAIVVGYAQTNVGGLVGVNQSGVIKDSSASGQVVGLGPATVGSVVGVNRKKLAF
ncbi:filamentous hemagglutinin N-terminal domain-containing protein [Pseudomonas protegens]|uniref:two-partner secretion domain-containing protein n=1 Tax=Pseudomonas protegens TaxID=380021 RepID=UPI0024C3104C|nr:filamentous hemagglutinin N-terminal domain-containing protein [Pseudomonas protegens]MDK1398375.1 filamentous hemagglutinin N-terminal domain-containing protein [Pseudomonas protegens]